ncbi:MAG: S9 family peptidase [Planctomycetota bacterium]
MKNKWVYMIAGALMVVPVVQALAELPPLIPRTVIFGNPDKAFPQVSPDGKRLAYLAPDEGVLNVWIRTIGQSDDQVVTKDRKRGIRQYFWAENNEQIIYMQDKGGDENWRIYIVDLKSKTEKDITPFDNVQARVEAVEQKFPNEILVSINNRDPQLHDVYRADLKTGKLTLEAQNDQGFIGWMVDHDFKVRGAMKTNPEGGSTVLVRDNPDSAWRNLVTFGPEDALGSNPVAFTPDGKGIYLTSSVGSNTAQLREMDLAGGKEKPIASDETYDVGDTVIHPTKKHVQAVAFTMERKVWKVLDPSIADDFAAIGRIRDGDFGIINRDSADQTWLIAFDVDNGPVYYYAYDRSTKKGTLLFTNRKALESLTLAKMKPVSFKARDGLTVNGYLTLPQGVDGKNLPMVLNVHGGPWARDVWGYNGTAQWLANRGYAVLQLNFRGSTGYGKKYLNAANREWGGAMHNDLIDGVNWAVKEGVADPKKIAIFGGSYGGYATLAGLAFTPEVFACGVDIVGPSSLITLMQTIPPYWKPMEPIFFNRVGHPEKDAEFLKKVSPLFHVDKITKPLMIAQGANDPRVKKAESLQMVDALKKAGKVVEYHEYADEGHGFARPENRLDFYGKAEKFLAMHLGGRWSEQ